ncbi:hypothetical protein M8J77_015920 [Diaphorina citri]|nr:hypothetical protein M8J77_015920 [Diaphorina citri]
MTDTGGYASLKDEEKLRGNLQGNSTNSLYSSIPLPLGPESLGSLEQAMLTSPPHASSHQTDGKEDLYTWMTKQQEDNDVAELSDTLTKTNKATYWDTSKLASSSTGTEATVLPGVVPSGPAPQSPPLASPDLTLLAASGYSLYPMHDNLRLLDAHLIFEPLLASLGVMPQQMISTGGAGSSSAGSLDSWGSNLSVAGTMGSMRVDIVESEVEKSGAGETWKKNKSDESTKFRLELAPDTGAFLIYSVPKSTKFRLELAPDTGAFLCERVHIGCEVRRAADLTLVEDLSRQRRNMLYVSRGQLKKHANTALNVSVSVRYISQQVTMPLLRLLHQISNMYTNVKVTQSELRDQVAPPLAKSPAPPPLGLGRLPPELFDKHKALVQADVKPVVSPSASVRSKHQSFVQKLRSTSKSVRGYMNLGDPPRDILPGILSGTAPLPLTEGRDSPSKQKPDDLPPLSTPRCWKTVYYLLDLYATMPETKTVAHRISMGAADVSDNFKLSQNQSANTSAKKPDDIDLEKGEGVHIPPPSTPTPIPAGPPQYSGPAREDRARLIVFAVARIHRTRLLATLSGLKLEAEITNLHSSLTYRKKTRPPSLECSLTGHLGRTMIVLLEGVAPNQQTVVKVTVDKSQALISSMSRRTKDKNSGFITIDRINIDIPQHPVVLHGMMTRGSKQLSSTLQELRVTRTSSRMSRGTTVDDVDSVPSGLGRDPPNTSPPHPREPPPRPPPPMVNTTEVMSNNLSTNTATNPLLSPFVMHFTGLIQSVTFTAALLPSLQAQYRMDQLTSAGVTGSKAKFVIDLPRHSLSFSTKVQVTEANLPSEASIDLPKIHVSAEYIQDGGNRPGDIPPTEGVTYRQGSYMSAVADIGIFEHSLTTDLLNHLVFVQKVFMKEVNEVIQKVYGGEKPVPIWEEDEPSSVSLLNYILFSLIVRVKRVQLTATTPTNSARVQLTATTPTNSAVRLETGSIELQLSNRIQNMSGASNNAGAKLFLKTHVDVNLSLGQVIRNVLFEEADPEFQHYAFFKTQIALRNAFQGEMIQPGSSSDDKEVILISLTRPLVYIQPVAVDKAILAILVWLNYKNAYDYWTEQCTDPGGNGGTGGNMMSNIASGLEKFSAGATTSTMGTLFLHLTVDDMGICVPLNPLPLTTWGLNRSLFMENDSCSAVVITLESTSIEACSSGSLVSKGQFIGLCLRFADDFETSLDDWKPDPSNDPSALMNLCVVSEGTYEVCSRTTTLKSDTENAKWFLNVKWQMEGVDIHLDVNIGKQLSALGHTLTTLTGVQEDETLNAYCDSDEDDDNTNNSQDSIVMKTKSRGTTECLSPLANPHLDPKKRSKLLEKEMYEQVKIISDLRALGASHGTIEQEMRRLHELEALVFRGFRRDMIQKLRRQSIKGKSQIKGKLGLETKTAPGYRSKNYLAGSVSGDLQSDRSKNYLASSVSDDLRSVETEAMLGHEMLASALTQEEIQFKTGSLKHHRVTFSETTGSLSRQPSLPSGTNSTRDSIDDLKSSYSEMSKLSEDSEETLEQGAHSETLRAPPKPQEPNIDFELDVKVFINRGKCVLHTKDNTRDDDPKLMSKLRKEKSWVGGVSDPGSPNMSRRSRENRPMSSSKLRHSTTLLQELTIFHIPGLDVKVHYESRTVPDDGLSPRYSIDHNGIITRKSSTKKASLYAWTTLHSIPEETIISPHILEFLEQTLEPIPAQERLGGGMHAMFDLGSDDPAPMPGQYVYASFPVDVIVYFHMQPSTFRFSCLPVSRVACLLQLPSLHLVFSSKRAEGNTCPEQGVAVGGLSITGCLADFSVYIFHPYGGKKTAGTSGANTSSNTQNLFSPLSDTERKDSLSVNVEFVKLHLSRSRSLTEQARERKDSLSVNVEFVKLHLSRSRSLTEQARGATIRFSTIVDIGSASFKYDMRRLTEILAFPKAWYRRNIMRRMFLGGDYPTRPSTSVFEPSAWYRRNIMRRMFLGGDYPTRPSTSVFEPSAWYRRNIMRRMFLGGDYPTRPSTSVFEPSAWNRRNIMRRMFLGGDYPTRPSTSVFEPSAWYRRNIMRRMFLGGDYPTRPSTSVFEPSDFDSSPETELELPLPKTSTPKSDRHRSDLPRDGSLKSPIHSESSTESATSNWNTLVLFAVNFKRLNVHMNMGNVMGNVMLLTKDFRSEGRLSVGSTGHKNLFISLGLGGASLDAKGGIVGGTIEISKVDTFILIKEDPSMEPEHTVGVKLWALELRLDYMGTGVVMTRVSSLEVSLRDEWRVKCSPSGGSTPTRRPALIFLHGNLKWDQLQLMISKSTSTDLAKMYSKLEEFFSQQFKSSKRVFTSLHTSSPDLAKMYSKLEEFFLQQFKSSKRVFTSLHTSSPGNVPSTSRGGPSILFYSISDLAKMYSKLEEFFSQQFKSSKRVFTSLHTSSPGDVPSTSRGGPSILFYSISDLAKMYSKLEEFFSQQFKSSKRVFTSLHTSSPGDVPSTSRGGPSKTKKLTPGTRKKHLVQGAPGSNNVTSPDMAWAKHHRHWQPVLAAVSGLRVSHLVTALPSWGSLLGGTLQLRGSHISLACFHGINFKSKSWALFSLKQPCISFATEAQEIRSHDVSEDLDVHIVETLTFSLGISTESPQVHHHSMATVCRLSRNVLFPPQFRTLHEWFHYAFACSEIDAVDRFPSLEREKENLSSSSSSGTAVDRFPSLEREKENLSSSSSSGTGTGHSETVRSRTPKLLEIPNHTREVIFALPSLQLNFETTHLQSSKVPPHNLLLEDSLLKPLVECSFITEFEDHIFVTVDAEAFFFLHDLITSYIKENKDKVVSKSYIRASNAEAFFFLHDLITSYIKENKDKVVLPLSIGSADKTPRTSSPDSPTLSSSSSTSTRNTSKPESADEKKSNQRALSQQKKSSDEIDELNKRDWRNFHCNTWHLEPTVRLLSWGGKSIEPYGVDYILQKLGFTHARTTIPKWMQRGFMDPLDKVLAVLLLRIVSVVREEPTPAPNRK